MESDSKDLINELPDPLLCHILSFLPTKEAASTSVLSRRWRHLLAFVHNLEFDDSVYLHPEERVKNPLHELGLVGFVIIVNGKRKKLSTSFLDFVNRILDLQGNFPVQKFSLKIVDTHDPVDPDCVIPWIYNALVRGVSDLRLVMNLNLEFWLPSRIFLSATLVRLSLILEGRDGRMIDVKDAHLPKLKSLYLQSVLFEKEDITFSKLLSGCPVLEELVMNDICSYLWKSCSVCVPTLKRLTFRWEEQSYESEYNPHSLTFDTPNLVYLEYTEVIANKYPKVNFGSLVEAKIDLRMSTDQRDEAEEASASELKDQFAKGDEENNMVGNATDFIMAIRNAQILYLSANTLEVLTFCCKPIPIFRNLTHLTIQSNQELGWESLPVLLKNCPSLETLVFQGLLHKATYRCGDVCLCKSREADDITCLSSNPVKVLKILINDRDEIEKQIEQVKHFLETMPHLEQLVLYYDSSFEVDVLVSTQLQMLTRVASPKCNVQQISGNHSLSSTKWVPLL